MIKSFENYTIKQQFADNSSQWEKLYSDGQTALAVIDNVGITRSIVKAAFDAQESGAKKVGCFQKSDFNG